MGDAAEAVPEDAGALGHTSRRYHVLVGVLEADATNDLHEELTEGIYELCCHPGYFDPTFEAVYHRDREDELKTLTDPALTTFVDAWLGRGAGG